MSLNELCIKPSYVKKVIVPCVDATFFSGLKFLTILMFFKVMARTKICNFPEYHNLERLDFGSKKGYFSFDLGGMPVSFLSLCISVSLFFCLFVSLSLCPSVDHSHSLPLTLTNQPSLLGARNRFPSKYPTFIFVLLLFNTDLFTCPLGVHRLTLTSFSLSTGN